MPSDAQATQARTGDQERMTDSEAIEKATLALRECQHPDIRLGALVLLHADGRTCVRYFMNSAADQPLAAAMGAAAERAALKPQQ